MAAEWKYGFSTHELREAFIIKYYGEGPAEHDYLKHYLLQPGDIYVEGGANVGRTAFLAQAMGAKAIMIEPSPFNIFTIEKKGTFFVGNGLPVTLVKKALSKEKKVGFLVMAGGKSDRLGESGDKIVVVEIDTLPNILHELNVSKVNLFACDIEGQEVEVVKQLDPKVELHLAIASYHLGTEEKVQAQIIDILKAKGYKNIVYEDGLVFASAE
jgi:FkbM family methyltransferase